MIARLATPQDKDKILILLDEFSSMLQASDIPSQISGPIFDEIMSRHDTYIFVVEDNKRLLGLGTLYILPNMRHGWKRGHIEDLFVTETERKRGVGSLLLNAIKEFCKNNNIKVIKLDSGNELLNAHAFYEKHGGKTTERFFRFDLD